MRKKIKICSKVHLQKLLKKYEYANPYFYSENDYINKFITNENIETVYLFELNNIVIKDKNYAEYYSTLNNNFNGKVLKSGLKLA